MKTRKKMVWKAKFYLESYLLSKEGKTDKQIAEIFGCSLNVLKMWIKAKPALADALAQGREQTSSTDSFIQYVYKRLPRELQVVWSEMAACEEEEVDLERMDALLDGLGVRSQQYLFFHALVVCNFNQSEAMGKIGLPRGILQRWIRDEKFAQLLTEFHEHKKNFFEGALVRLVRNGDSAATIFANKTMNRDRGYNDKTVVEINQRIEHTVNLEKLQLPLEVRKVILEAMRQLEERTQLESALPAGLILEHKPLLVENETEAPPIEGETANE